MVDCCFLKCLNIISTNSSELKSTNESNQPPHQIRYSKKSYEIFCSNFRKNYKKTQLVVFVKRNHPAYVYLFFSQFGQLVKLEKLENISYQFSLVKAVRKLGFSNNKVK